MAAKHNQPARIVGLELAKINRNVKEESVAEFVCGPTSAQTCNGSLRRFDGKFCAIGNLYIAQFSWVRILIYFLSALGAEKTVAGGFEIPELHGPSDVGPAIGSLRDLLNDVTRRVKAEDSKARSLALDAPIGVAKAPIRVRRTTGRFRSDEEIAPAVAQARNSNRRKDLAVTDFSQFVLRFEPLPVLSSFIYAGCDESRSCLALFQKGESGQRF